MRGKMAVLMTMAAAAGCGEAPVAVSPPRPVPEGPSANLVGSPVACTHRWASAVSGLWADATKWSAGTVPDTSSVVCITVAGSYIVNAPSPVPNVERIYLGDGSSFTQLQVSAVSGANQVLRARDVTIEAGARLWLASVPLDVERRLVVEGTLHSDAFVDAKHIVIEPTGTALVTGTLGWGIVGDAPTFTNRGTVQLGAGDELTLSVQGSPTQGSVHFEGGAVRGAGTLGIRGAWNSSVPYDVVWDGGALEAPTGDTTRAIVKLRDLRSLRLGSAALTGVIDIDPYATDPIVEGEVGAGVQLRAWGQPGWGGSIRLGAPGARLVNRGRIHLRHDDPSITLTVGGAVTNMGTLLVGPGDVALELDTLTNSLGGTLSLQVPTRFSKPGGVLQNQGKIPRAHPLAMVGSTFVALPPGTMATSLTLEAGGRLTGRGAVADVTSAGGIVAPSDPLEWDPVRSRFGALTMPSLALDSTSRVIVDIRPSDDGPSDRITVAGAVTYGGTLELDHDHGFVTGEHCGTSVPVIVNGRTVGHAGAFRSFVGLGTAQSTGGWRPHETPTALSLHGYAPSAPMAFSPANPAVTEGGPGVTVDLCLGGPTPTASVTATLTSLGGEVTSTPGGVTFTTADFMLAKRVTLRAVDDAAGEGPHRDSVRVTLASSDSRFSGAIPRTLWVDITDDDPPTDLLVELAAPVLANVALDQVFEVAHRVRNIGPGASSGATVTVTPLAGVVHAFNSPQVSCSASAGRLTCTLPPLAAGAQLDFNLGFRATAAGVHSNTSAVRGNEYDDVAANDAFIWTITVP